MARYVILQHDACPDREELHWDFMLESGGMLRTWALAQEPVPHCEITAAVLPDHRLEYLDYEGPISGNRGTVTRWDTGQYEMLSDSPSELALQLVGQRLNGLASLKRGLPDSQRWIFRFAAPVPGNSSSTPDDVRASGGNVSSPGR